MFYYSRWLSLPLTTRAALAKEFGIAKTGPTHVQDNRVVSDGYFIKDVENAISKESLQKFLSTDEDDIEVLWVRMIDKAEGREVVAIVVEATETPVETPKKEKKQRKARAQ